MISSFKLQNLNFQNSKVSIFKISSFKFQTLSFKFQVSSFKEKKNLFQGTTKIRQDFHANEKIQIKKEQMEITHLKNNGTTKPSSFKV